MPQHSYDFYQVWSSHGQAKDEAVGHSLVLPLPKVQELEFILLSAMAYC